MQYIRFQPCKTQITQNLFPRDKVSRVEFGNVILGIINEDHDALILALMSDEAQFHVTFSVNIRNMPYWTTVDRIELREQALNSPEVTGWCGVKTFGMGGQFSFEN